MKIYVKKTKKYLTLWYFTYMYDDDLYANKGWGFSEMHFIGTIDNYEEMKSFEQSNYGANHYNVKKRHATEEEYKGYVEYFLAS